MLIVFGFIGVLTAFAQAPDTTSPAITGVSATGIGQTFATINWTTNEAADGQVEYGTSTAYGLSSSLVTATTTAHNVSLLGLTASTTYHYLVKSKDATGNLATSTDYSFTTLAQSATTTAAVTVKVNPRTLNIKSMGKRIDVDVIFPRGYDARQIDVASIKLNGTLAPVKVKVKNVKWYEVFRWRRAARIEMKFLRADVINLLSIGATATSTASTASSTATHLPLFSFATKEVTVSGKVGADTFSGTTTVRVLIKNIIPVAARREGKDYDHDEKEWHQEHSPATSTSMSMTATTITAAATTTGVTVLSPFKEKKKEIKEQHKEKKEVRKNERKKKKDGN